MEIRVVDFEVLTRNYTNYQEGITKMEELRKSFVDRMEPIKTEMESIIKAANSGLIMDAKSQQENNEKFSMLQERAMSIDNEYKTTMRAEQDGLNKKTYNELETIITEWVDGKGIDLVMGRMEIVYANNNKDITEDILNVLREKNLFTEFVEQTEENQNLVVEDLR